MLLRNPTRDSRIEWTSSLDARAETYEKDNIQLLRGPTPYEGSKFQTDLICTALAHTEASKPLKDGEAKLLHMLVSPGICHTANTGPVLTSFLEMVKVLAFYIVCVIMSCSRYSSKCTTGTTVGIPKSPNLSNYGCYCACLWGIGTSQHS